MSTDLPSLLEEHRAGLEAFVARHAGFTLRYEGADDLVQGVLLRALDRGKGFRYEGREPFLAWIHAIARSHLADRKEYWSALKRRSSRMLRLTWGGTTAGGVSEPMATGTGPSTFAARREQLELAVKVLGALLPRDAQLVRWATEDVPLDEQARRLSISYDAAKRASARAFERFRTAYRLAAG